MPTLVHYHQPSIGSTLKLSRFVVQWILNIDLILDAHWDSRFLVTKTYETLAFLEYDM